MAVIAALALIAIVISLIATLAPYPTLWRDHRKRWRETPARGRRRLWMWLSAELLFVLAIGALLIAKPWGAHTDVWVILLVGGIIMVFTLALAIAHAVTDVRRARARRARKAR